MRRKDVPRETLERLYIQKGLSTRQVGRRLDICKTTVLTNLRQHGIPIRTSRQGWNLRWKHDENFRNNLRRIIGENRPKPPWTKGKPRKPETRKKISEKTKGRRPWNKGLTNENHPSLKTISQKLSGIKRHRPSKRPTKKKLIQLYIEQKLSRRELAKTLGVVTGTVDKWLQFYGIQLSEEERHRRKALPLGEEARRRQIATMKRVVSQKREMFLKNLFCTSKPTSIERKFMVICEEQGFPFRYVGNGSFWIGNLNPDFINIQNKQVIETLGEYWHTENEVAERAKRFVKYGYQPLMIWQSELKDEEKIVNKVRRWMDANSPILQTKY